MVDMACFCVQFFCLAVHLEEDKAREIESALHTHREQWREARDLWTYVMVYVNMSSQEL